MSIASLTKKALKKNSWPLQEIAGLTVVQSALLGAEDKIVHAFTTRLGGASASPLNWFNLGRHWPTDESRQDAVANRRRLCAALAVPYEKLTVPGQKHTANIYFVDQQQAAPDQLLDQVDGAVCNQPGLPLLLHFADCVPIMILDRRQCVLAVLHAGWRGTASGIATNAVRMFSERFNSRPADLAAAIGPAIGSCCYPTGDDVAERLLRSVQDGDDLIARKDDKPHPDLKAINAMQLLICGVNDIDVCNWCTCCNPEIFYSHRQSRGNTGRQGALACIR